MQRPLSKVLPRNGQKLQSAMGKLTGRVGPVIAESYSQFLFRNNFCKNNARGHLVIIGQTQAMFPAINQIKVKGFRFHDRMIVGQVIIHAVSEMNAWIVLPKLRDGIVIQTRL